MAKPKRDQDEDQEKTRAREEAELAAREANERAEESKRAAEVAQRKAVTAKMADAATRGKVIAIVPKEFRLTVQGNQVIVIRPGTQELDEEHARHWWSKRMGVKIFGEEEAPKPE